MGNIIRLPTARTACPPTTDRLGTAESVLLLAVRWWVADFRSNLDPLPRLCGAMGIAGAHDAAFSVDQFMSIAARTARRPIAIHCPRCPNLSDDERCVLHAAGLTQAGASNLAKRVLHNGLLSADGANFALGTLEGLGELFRMAHLDFGRRPESEGNALGEDGTEPCMLPGQRHPLH
jgi:hypothetical protein